MKNHLAFFRLWSFDCWKIDLWIYLIGTIVSILSMLLMFFFLVLNICSSAIVINGLFDKVILSLFTKQITIDVKKKRERIINYSKSKQWGGKNIHMNLDLELHEYCSWIRFDGTYEAEHVYSLHLQNEISKITSYCNIFVIGASD